jgi:hypothetical protein
MAYKNYKTTAILNSEKVAIKDEYDIDDPKYPRIGEPLHKNVQVLELPNSDYINTGLNFSDLRKYNLKSVTIVKGRNTIIEIFK